MSKEADVRSRHVGRPECNGAFESKGDHASELWAHHRPDGQVQATVLMSELSYSVGAVDLQDIAGPELCALLADERPCRRVLVLEVAGLRGRDEKVVIGKEGQPGGLDVVLEFTAPGRRRSESPSMQDTVSARTVTRSRPGRR